MLVFLVVVRCYSLLCIGFLCCACLLVVVYWSWLLFLFVIDDCCSICVIIGCCLVCVFMYMCRCCLLLFVVVG